MTQSARGKAFEYALAKQISRVTDTPLDQQTTTSRAEQLYSSSSEIDQLDSAAREAALFLKAYDRRMDDAISIRLQSDSAGMAGDVRDVIVQLPGSDSIGLSAKNNHTAIKHSRLSPTIDFGRSWADYPVSSRYWDAVCPTFKIMADMRDEGKLFRDVPNKEAMFYLPILTGFEDEFRRLCESFGKQFIARVFQYLIGNYDFYKVIRTKRYVAVQSFNMNGTLEWGQRWTIPKSVEQVRRKPGSTNTLLVSFAGGWQISFRLHNASSKVEPSLKFDIQFVGLPPYAAGNQIPLSKS